MTIRDENNVIRPSRRFDRALRVGFLLLVASASATVEVFAEVRVIDGDTLDVDGQRHRLFGIDAAERQQHCVDAAGKQWDCAADATATLKRLVAGRQVVCDEVAGTRDGFGRTISRCRVGDVDLAAALVAEGLAWAFRRYSSDYIENEVAARQAGVGIWSLPEEAGSNEAPWAWRARQRRGRESQAATQTASTRDPDCRIKGNISASGRVYHLPTSRDWAKTRISEARGERWFCSENEAIAAGWRAARGR